jgi:hypothetical protein
MNKPEEYPSGLFIFQGETPPPPKETHWPLRNELFYAAIGGLSAVIIIFSTPLIFHKIMPLPAPSPATAPASAPTPGPAILDQTQDTKDIMLQEKQQSVDPMPPLAMMEKWAEEQLKMRRPTKQPTPPPIHQTFHYRHRFQGDPQRQETARLNKSQWSR